MVLIMSLWYIHIIIIYNIHYRTIDLTKPKRCILKRLLLKVLVITFANTLIQGNRHKITEQN